MKIGLFIPNATFDLPGSAEVGGIEVYAFELGEALLKRGHEVILFGGEPKAGKTYRSSRLTLSLHPYIETKNIWKLGTRFRKLIQRWHFCSSSMEAVAQAQCDVMFVFKPYDFINAWRWKKKGLPLKVVMNYQGKDFFPTDHYWKRFIDWEYAASEDNAKLAQERYGVLPDVFPNGVDTDIFKPAFPRPMSGRFRILTAGRMVGWKGLEYLIEAAASVDKVELLMAGDGPERAKLESLVQKLSMSHRVQFLGLLSMDSLAKTMGSMDGFAQPSIDFDACPTAVLQALSSGTIVLMSDQVGLRKYFPPPSSWHIPARDVKAWSQALSTLVSLPEEEMSRFGNRARGRVLEKFSWSSIAAQMEEKLFEVVGRKDGQG
ncbi:MAG: glycosyltransferase family 4 protein [Verrucomicrobiales bacterium]